MKKEVGIAMKSKETKELGSPCLCTQDVYKKFELEKRNCNKK